MVRVPIQPRWNDLTAGAWGKFREPLMTGRHEGEAGPIVLPLGGGRLGHCSAID